LPQRLISYKDTFQNDRGDTFTFGYNNDWLGYFPLNGSEEGVLFVNHEYPDPFFQHGYKKTDVNPGRHTESPADVQAEQDAVGNSIVHVKRSADGTCAVVSPSPYNRRIYGDRPNLEFTGPLRGAPGVGTSARGAVGNCSGVYAPWGTALSCEENYDGYGVALGTRDFYYGWPQNGGQPEDADYEFKNNKKYGWVVEHDPYDPDFTPRKHTALGRFRHENGLPARSRAQVRPLHGRRRQRPVRLQVRLRHRLQAGRQQQWANPRVGHAVRGPLPAGGP